jgi:hypothetical protein
MQNRIALRSVGRQLIELHGMKSPFRSTQGRRMNGTEFRMRAAGTAITPIAEIDPANY